jgi:hypothetical protein
MFYFIVYLAREVTNNSRRVGERGRYGINNGDFIIGREEDMVFLEGSQASPARPSGKGSVEVKALGWLEVVA